MESIRFEGQRKVIIHSLSNGAVWIIWSWLLFFWMGPTTLNKVRNSFSLDQVMVASNHIYADFLWFFISQLFILLILSAAIYLISLPLFSKFNKTNKPLLWVYFVSFLIIYNLLVLHGYMFPYSAHAMGEIIPQNIGFLIILYLIPAALLLFVSLFACSFWLCKIYRFKKNLLYFLIPVMSAAILFKSYASVNDGKSVSNNIPNIIVIGLDSYDLTALHQDKKNTQINRFVSNAVLFENTKTTLARTYVAWSSFLTGKYPVNNGIRFNLNPRLEEQKSHFLIEEFKTVGYKAYYSSDEMRFSNLGEFHGFDGVIGSKVGALDFLFGNLIDMPFSNLLLSTSLGGFFFPYAYGNRAVAHTYSPDDYFDILNVGLDDMQQSGEPIFLSLHLCLAHWPYHHASTKNHSGGYEAYKDSINDLNEMAEALFDNLKNRRMLENSVIVFMSDHGEGFPEKYGNERNDFSSHGHGTNLLDEDQNRILFAIQYYKNGSPEFKSAKFDYPASIMDIIPTIADVIGIDLGNKGVDGLSLLPLIEGDFSKLPAERPRFLETEIHLKTMENLDEESNIDVNSVVEEAIKYYQISQDGRLEINAVNFPELLKRKDRAVELNGQYLVWNDLYGYRFFNYLKRYSAVYDPSEVDHKKLMDFFCVHFLSDLNMGYLPNKCEDT